MPKKHWLSAEGKVEMPIVAILEAHILKPGMRAKAQL
jgi:hypothetical protein